MCVPCLSRPQFAKNNSDTAHFAELRKRVHERLLALPANRHRMVTAKAILLPLLYGGLYLLSLQSTSYGLFCLAYVCLGIMLVVLFLNLIHEACHDNLFRSKKANRVYMLLFDAIGANSYMWKKRHIRLHHHFTNVQNWDSDIEKSKFLKVHPHDHDKLLPRYQHLLIFLYPFFITNWFLVRDFKDFFDSRMIVRRLGAVPLVEYGKLFFFKAFFTGYLVGVPLWFTPFTVGQLLIAFLVLLVSAGFFALVVLLPPHVNTTNQFPEAGNDGQLHESWFRHQFLTTNDVQCNNWFSRHVMGNFNYHLAHHLFPNISYVYAPEVTAVIRDYALQQGLPYRSYPLWYTFRAHYRLIRQNGQALDILNEDM